MIRVVHAICVTVIATADRGNQKTVHVNGRPWYSVPNLSNAEIVGPIDILIARDESKKEHGVKYV